MAIYVGMTHREVQVRLSEHQSRDFPNATSARTLSTHRTKTQARAAEKAAAERLRCPAGPAGSGPEVANWKVYALN